MRLLANENVPGIVVEALRAAGHDVAWIRTDAPGATDESVLGRARQAGRVLLTFDKDFGTLAYHRGSVASPGVILLRLSMLPDALAGFVVGAIASRTDWEGNFSVIEPARVRMRPLAG